MKVLKTGFAALAFLATGSVVSAETVTLRVSHWVPKTSMPAPEWDKWLQSMEAASDGELKVEIYPAGQLGKAADHYDLARDGVVDLAWAVPGFNAGRFPIFSASELPLIFSNVPAGVHVFDTWYAQYRDQEMGDVHYCVGHVSPLSTLNFTSKQVNAPEEMQGLRIRPQNTISGRFFAGLGANIIQISAAEAAQAFDRGLLDGIAFPWRTLYAFGLEKSVKYHMDLPLTSAPSAWVMNKARYESLPPAAKTAVDSHCTPEWAERMMQGWQDWEGEARRMLTDGENTIYPVTMENQEKWKKAANDFHAAWVADNTTATFDAGAAISDFKAKLVEAGAGY